MNRCSQNSIFLIALLSVLFACASFDDAPTAAPSAVPSATATFVPTATPTIAFLNYPNMTPELIPTPTPPAVLYAMDDTLREFPLNLDATWIYSSTNYETLEGGELITTTWRVTDTVAAVETRSLMHAAHIVRSTALISTTRDFSTLPYAENYFNNMQNPQDKWLIVDGNKIYQQWDLDWTNIANSRLIYIFPLSQDNRWYPDPEQRALFSPYKADPIPNGRIISWQGEYAVAAGAFLSCFEVHEIYNSGDTIEWFCSTVGIVAEQFDHSGTPFGFRSELVQFIAGK